MNIDTTEMQRIVEATGAGRVQLYTGIHKALRARMATVLTRVGQMDARDDLHCREVMNDLEELLDALHGHLETENAMVHPAIEARFPGALADVIVDHEGHAKAILQLHRYVRALPILAGAERAAFALFLYRQLSVFVGENLEHMQVEETHNQQLLWAAYSDDELQAMHAAIVASLPPEKMAVLLPWIISAASAEERLQMLSGMRATAPAFVFEGALEVARSCLSSREWGKLGAELGVAQIGGLAAFA
jgi:hypothetical protein